jgi:hypothetical protein
VVSETSREYAFCAQTILGAEPLLVPDATVDPRFRDNHMVAGPPFIRFDLSGPPDSDAQRKLGAAHSKICSATDSDG